MFSLFAQNWSDPSGDAPARLSDLEAVFGNIVSVALSFAGIVFFIMLITGGFKLITASGEAPKVEAAQKTLTYAIAGLVFIALSFFFLRFIQVFTGVNVTEFRVTQ